MAPEELFEPDRLARPSADVTLFRVLISQPLDENWNTFSGRLMGQEDWDSYLAEWGVLAKDQDQAVEIALMWQSRCYPMEPRLDVVAPSEDEFADSPGIVWQGSRFPPPDDLFDDDGGEFE